MTEELPPIKLDVDAMIVVIASAIKEAMTHAEHPMGFMLILGTPGEDGDARYASNLQTEGAIETLGNVLNMLKLIVHEPEPEAKPN